MRLGIPIKIACHLFVIIFAGRLVNCPANGEGDDSWGGIRLFKADLSAHHQTTLTHSDGTGFAKVRFDLNIMEITWEVEYDSLTSPPPESTFTAQHSPALMR